MKQGQSSTIFLLGIAILACARPAKALPPHSPIGAPIINIWVHGTVLNTILPGPLSNLFYNKNYCYCSPGLKHFSTLDKQFHHHTLMQTLSTTDPANFPAESLYLFGWSGYLSDKARSDATKKLHDELSTLVKDSQQRFGKKPFIRIISHSHGGTIALNLGKEKHNDYTVEELILLGCPVYEANEARINDQLFGSIYALNTPNDYIQMIGSGLSFTQQFKPHPKLTQLTVTSNGLSLLHTNFKQSTFVKHLPSILLNAKAQRTYEMLKGPFATSNLSFDLHNLAQRVDLSPTA